LPVLSSFYSMVLGFSRPRLFTVPTRGYFFFFSRHLCCSLSAAISFFSQSGFRHSLLFFPMSFSGPQFTYLREAGSTGLPTTLFSTSFFLLHPNRFIWVASPFFPLGPCKRLSSLVCEGWIVSGASHHLRPRHFFFFSLASGVYLHPPQDLRFSPASGRVVLAIDSISLWKEPSLLPFCRGFCNSRASPFSSTGLKKRAILFFFSPFNDHNLLFSCLPDLESRSFPTRRRRLFTIKRSNPSSFFRTGNCRTPLPACPLTQGVSFQNPV